MENLPIATLIIATLTLIVTTIYVILTWRIASATKESAKATEKSADISSKVLEEMREARDQETAPYVVVYFDVLSYSPLILLAVKNIGKSTANNVKLEFDPQLKSSIKPINEASFIKNGIGSMPPGYEILAILDGPNYFMDNNNPLSYKVKVSYSGGILSEPRFNEYVLDLLALKLTPLGLKTMTHLVNEIDKLTKSVNSIAEKLDKYPNSEITEDVFDTEKSRSDTQESDNTKSAK
jgi:hypothetical protein